MLVSGKALQLSQKSLARYKHSSILIWNISDDERKFYIIICSELLMLCSNKLECWYFSRPCSLVRKVLLGTNALAYLSGTLVMKLYHLFLN